MATILLIEDDEITRKLCAAILGEEHSLLEAKNSNEGLRLLRECKPDLVITDLMVPDPNGQIPTENDALKLITLLRSFDNRVKIIVYSVLCYEPLNRRKALSLGADDCLIKPGSIDTLQKTISTLLASIPSKK